MGMENPTNENMDAYENNESKWYRVVAPSAHLGSCKTGEHTNFVFANNAVEAWGKAKKIRGWKRDQTPDIRELNEEEIIDLLKMIDENPYYDSIDAVKRVGYMSNLPEEKAQKYITERRNKRKKK